MRSASFIDPDVKSYVDYAVQGAYMKAQAIRSALANRATLAGNPTVHTPTADTITAIAGIKLTARASGLFLVTMSVQAAAAANDVVTWTVTYYSDAVPGTPLTLPANALAAGINCFTDDTGAGIAPSAGATGGTVVTAPSHTVAAANDLFEWSGLVGGVGYTTSPGETFYLTLSVTNTVASRALSQLTLSAVELPA